MYSRLLVPPKNKSFFLFGPRGTGKTTWVKSVFPKAIYIDLLESETFNRLLANPQRLEEFIPPQFDNFIIIDEIQRVPLLLNEIHRLIEAKRYKFILTGSSARKLRRQGHNLLAGRALTYYFHPLTAIELGKDFNLTQALNFGTLPSIPYEEDPQKYLQSYITTYLEEEISQEGMTRNLSAFARFMETASFSQGSILNTSEVARESSVERKVVENYFSILEDLLIGCKLPAFNKRSKRRLTSKNKFYFFDTGIYQTIKPKGPLDNTDSDQGIALETLFFQNLRAVNDNLNLNYKLYYYRTATGLEVDFIAYGEKGLHAFEVKRSQKINSSSKKSLQQFHSDYPQAKCHLIYTGNKHLWQDNIEIIPITQALKNLSSILN